MNDDRPLVRIVGGGMTGLTVALRLSHRGFRTIVHEQVPYLGGLSSEDELGGVPVERFYHCVLPTDDALLSLFEELELTDQVGWNRTRTGFFTGDRLLEMTTSADFMRFPAIGITDRARLAWTIAYCGMKRDWRSLDREPIGPFLRRHSGDRLFEAIWEPLLRAKLGPDYDRFAASFIWATVYRMLSARKAKGRSEKLGFVRGRYGKVFSALRGAIEHRGGSVVVGQPVDTVTPSPDDDGWQVRAGDDSYAADAVVLSVPAPVASRLLGRRVEGASENLDHVDYLGVVCEQLLLRRSLTPYYVLNLTDGRTPFTGVIETSNLTGTDEYDGHTLVYLPRYRDQSSPLWETDDDVIHAESMEGLRRIVPELADDDVAAWHVHRARYVQPVHPVNWGEQLPPVRLAPGLAYVATAQVHPWPVFNDEVVRHVDRSLSDLMTTLRERVAA